MQTLPPFLRGPIKCRYADIDDVNFIHTNLENLLEEEQNASKYSQTIASLTNALFSEEKFAECIVAEFNSNMAGFILYSVTNQNFTVFPSPGLFVHDMYVCKEYRRKGIAKALGDYLITIAKSKKYSRIDGILLKDNQVAMAFYQNNVKDINVLDYINYMRLNLNI